MMKRSVVFLSMLFFCGIFSFAGAEEKTIHFRPDGALAGMEVKLSSPSVQNSTPIVSEADAKNDLEYFVKQEDVKRRYIVHFPAIDDHKSFLPVVIVFHDTSTKPEVVRRQSQMNRVADQYGFMVVYPEGSGRFPTFNAGGCCGYAAMHSVDDVGFVRLLLEDLKMHHPVNPGRVYAAGVGNGAMMAYRLACEMPDQIAAVGAVAGDLQADQVKPKRPIPVIHFHGFEDQIVPYDGGVGKRSFQSVQHRSAQETMGWWVNVNKCQEKPVEVRREADFQMARYEPLDGVPGAPVVLYALPDGGHTWPGGVDVSGFLGDGQLVSSVDASTLIWRFFDQFNVGGLRRR